MQMDNNFFLRNRKLLVYTQATENWLGAGFRLLDRLLDRLLGLAEQLLQTLQVVAIDTP